MSRVTLVLGGARSGKSAFAEQLAVQSGQALHYIATGQAWDDEMRERIATHRQRRGGLWTTHEAPVELSAAIASLDNANNTILVDCLTLWVTNLMMGESDMDAAFEALLNQLSGVRAHIIFVSNEVGMGIVPENAMARQFRDLAGSLHQKIAAQAEAVYLVAAGLPLKLKG
ncbi:bifunctional adenosylcobinamide kinase/adenosylcobinamide-phosphate guanylyltransferase [Rhizobium sp. L1K21]|uniref:bifunctional adenosylcobinamide kinase/adenosylcobinamide-phosphate guanylyltransferase n=1 Tax=Rhizobium sp. L1K21 TaxID=2954933 RepID=UPI002093BE7F|nr:bifunctional adenosylcobinamide kinase/adenosylcobinamide-phosphate guanylyltransferase [Rhizobium sp. L1K21]MCO6185785.1 bifunctional adenosylcobinamide kinase/adenosylcobinamide-phosphate guanylyltransferase [Rhizobium sp. L1K21]